MTTTRSRAVHDLNNDGLFKITRFENRRFASCAIGPDAYPTPEEVSDLPRIVCDPRLIAWQMIEFMKWNGKVRNGPNFDKLLWYGETLPEAHFDDKLWAYAIREAERLINKRDDRGDVATYAHDQVLNVLLQMGLLDWEDPNERMAQSKQAMRYSAVTASRIWFQLKDLKQRVSLQFTPVSECY
jgi:hypothetical protein